MNMHVHNVYVEHPDGTRTYLGTLWIGDLENRVHAAIKEWESKRDAYADFRKTVEDAATRAHMSW